MFHEKRGDLWDAKVDYRLIFTNGIYSPRTGRLVMGGGVARQARDRFADLDLRLGRLVRNHGNKVYLLPELHLISFPTKDDFRRPSTLARIQSSLEELVELVHDRPTLTFAMGWPGCGLGGLERAVVRPLLEAFLDERFTVLDPHHDCVPL